MATVPNFVSVNHSPTPLSAGNNDTVALINSTSALKKHLKMGGTAVMHKTFNRVDTDRTLLPQQVTHQSIQLASSNSSVPQNTTSVLNDHQSTHQENASPIITERLPYSPNEMPFEQEQDDPGLPGQQLLSVHTNEVSRQEISNPPHRIKCYYFAV